MIIDNAPAGFSRRELFVDAKDLRSRQEGSDAQMTAEEYAAVLQTRGAEKLNENQLVRAFTATVRTHDPTYTYGVDFFPGDTITVIDERLGVQMEAVVQGAARAVSREGESLSLILGYSQPTLYERLQRKAAK